MLLEGTYNLFQAGYGGGKTETMIMMAILDALDSPTAKIGMYYPTYSAIEDIVWDRFINKLTELGIPHVTNMTSKRIKTLHPQMGDFYFHSMEHPEKIVGYEYYRSHIDELDTLPYDKAQIAFDKICGRQRQIPRGFNLKTVQNKVRVYSTPEGYKFLYDRWEKNRPSDDYQSVKAKSFSNPFLPKSYIDLLKTSFSGPLVAAYLNGEFVNMASGTVYYAFDREKHDSTEVIRDFDTELHIGMDFNVDKQCATVFVKRTNVTGNTVWHAVDELVNMFDTPEAIDRIKKKYPGKTIFIYPDASGQARKTVGASQSDVSLLQQAGFVVRVNPANPKVKDRVIATNTAFDQNKVFVNVQACPNVATCLEQQAYDKQGNPEKNTGRDHQNDATTYFIAHKLPVQMVAAPFRIQWYEGYK
jgi:phage terminase large subunit